MLDKIKITLVLLTLFVALLSFLDFSFITIACCITTILFFLVIYEGFYLYFDLKEIETMVDEIGKKEE